MRQLYILRHAQAASPQGVDDKHRPLTRQGLADARALGQLMDRMEYKPDYILCSPARRTRQTLAKIQETLGPDTPVGYASGLYFATTGQLYDHLKRVDSKYRNIMLVSHNPSVHGLARFLTGLGPPDLLMLLELDYRECTMAALDCPIDSWASLLPAQCDLKNLLIPGKDFRGEIVD